MEIRNIDNSQSFTSFYRHSQPCMKYLEKYFNGNKLKFEKALVTLDEKCSKHKNFDMFYSPEDDSIKIVPKTSQAKQYSEAHSGGNYISIYSKSDYDQKNKLYDMAQKTIGKKLESENVFRRILSSTLEFLRINKIKKYIGSSPYDNLPYNVREAVDLIERMERSI